MIKILNWNIQSGGGSRINEIIKRISFHGPSIVVLTEFRNGQTGNLLQKILLEKGFQFQATGTSEAKINSTFIASKIPFTKYQTFPELGVDSHRLIEVDFQGFSLLAFYFPQKEAKRPVFNFLIKLARVRKDKPAIWIGDLNTGKHYVDEHGTTFHCAEYIDLLLDSGKIDAWRNLHGGKKEYTWFSNAGNGFRIDHAFVNVAMLPFLSICRYSHNEREEKISDHSILLIELRDPSLISGEQKMTNKQDEINLSQPPEKPSQESVHASPPPSGYDSLQDTGKNLILPSSLLRNANFVQWRKVATSNGTVGLFDYFFHRASQLSGVRIEPWKNRSITLNISGKPVIKIFPKKGNPAKGIWLGFKDENLFLTTRNNMPKSAIPPGFERKEQGWDEGYVNSTELIDQVLSVL